PRMSGGARLEGRRREPVAAGQRPAAETSIRPWEGRIHVKRAYEPHASSDGRRVLVDRLWPRGLTKHDLADALWLRDVAPSAGLRKWFGHKPERWAEFRSRYFDELRSNQAIGTLRDLVAAGPVTLIYGARDEMHNQAVALAAYLGKTAPPAAKAK
ncbi:MAG: DUF488 domain-containing protein, partial [Caulobacteraceae bacterium]